MDFPAIPLEFDLEVDELVSSLESVPAVPHLSEHTYPYVLDPDTTQYSSHPPDFVDSSLDSIIPSISHVSHPPPLVPATPSATPSSVPCSFSDCEMRVPEVPNSNLLGLSRCPIPGELGFKVLIENNNCKLKLVDDQPFVQRNVSVPCFFSTAEKKNFPLNSSIRITVIYEALADMKSKGPVRNASSDKRFMECPGHQALYTTYMSHDCVVLNVSELLSSEKGPFSVISFTCTSSELNGTRTKKAPPLLLLFHLLIDGKEVALDVMKLKVCCCIHRDSQRFAVKRKGGSIDELSIEKKRPTATAVDPVFKEKVDPHLNLAEGYVPNKDGLYTFTWQGKDITMLNLFLCLKAGYESFVN